MHATDFMNLSALDLAPLQVPAKTKVCDRSNLLSEPDWNSWRKQNPKALRSPPSTWWLPVRSKGAFYVYPVAEYTKAPRVILFYAGAMI